MQSGTTGIFLRKGTAPLVTVAKLNQTPGNTLDTSLPSNAVLTTVGIERDGFRGSNLALTAGGVYYVRGEEFGWAGIYLTLVPLAD